MGAGASSRDAQLSLTDPKVCRSFLAGTCPHDLFTNTKQDLGPCSKVHSEPLKSEYEAASDKSKYGFEYDYMRDMQKYIDECNRRIDAAQRRLEKTPDEIRQTNDLVRASLPCPSACFGTSAEIDLLYFCSLNKSPTSPALSILVSLKYLSLANQLPSPPLLPSSTRSALLKPRKKRRSANSNHFQTPPGHLDIRNCRCAMSVERI